MAFTKIENSDFNNAGALRMPNKPSETMTAQAIKQMFDAPSREVVAPKFNDLIDELEATTAAAQIGAVAPVGARGDNVQAILNSVFGAVSTAVVDVAEIKAELSSVVVSVEELEEEAHTHENKELLDTYTQSDEDLSSAVESKHTHSNKALLDTYEQTESDLADAVSAKHSHSNKDLLDTYEQSESDLADAVSKKHSHSNKALLDTYTQTESDLASAVTNNHTHSNKSVLDKFGESSGTPTYDGNPIGGDQVQSDWNEADSTKKDYIKNKPSMYSAIKVATRTLNASGADTFELKAGSNVSLSANISSQIITISAGETSTPSIEVTPILTSGVKIAVIGVGSDDYDLYAPQGGSSSGDMKQSDYDSDSTVKNAGGIKRYVQSEISSQITSALTASY